MELLSRVFLSNKTPQHVRNMPRCVALLTALSFLLVSITPAFCAHLTVDVEDDRKSETISNVQQLESSRQYVSRQVDVLREKIEQLQGVVDALSENDGAADGRDGAALAQAVATLTQEVRAQAVRVEKLESTENDMGDDFALRKSVDQQVSSVLKRIAAAESRIVRLEAEREAK